MNLQWYGEVKAPVSVLIFGKLAYQQYHIQNNLKQRVRQLQCTVNVLKFQTLSNKMFLFRTGITKMLVRIAKSGFRSSLMWVCAVCLSFLVGN